jgi:rubrerythrin
VRAATTCPKCQHSEIVFLPRVTDFQESVLAAYVSNEDWPRRGKPTVRGALHAYICRQCGYTELYADEPEQIPIDRIPGAKLLKRRAPYR